MKSKIIFIGLIMVTATLWAQVIETQLPLKKVVILTSGLAYYEHSGSINGSTNVTFPFRLDAVNDALKTLVVNDPSTANPSISYQSENTLLQTLRSLSIDLSDMPDFANILLRLRGAEAIVTSSAVYTGRIIGIEHRMTSGSFSVTSEPWLLLNTNENMMSFNLKEISSIKFTDPVIEQDLNRALDLIAASRNQFSRQLIVNLPVTTGRAARNVSISYVIPSPVWKVSYRLDLGTLTPLLQGWAIVDNDSDTDWNNVELSLVTGRPSSFIQELYPPYYVTRPVMPLAIAGTATAVTHERSAPMPMAAPSMARQRAEVVEYEMMAMDDSAGSARNQVTLGGGAVQTAEGTAAGGQFEFTIKHPVSLNRRMSAMYPLVESNITARKILIYNGRGRHPRLGAELTNTSKMKLPAGPITVYDVVYAGDALIEFWNEDEKRLISYGEDLSVTASTSDTNTRAVSTVRISGGVMTINRNVSFVKTYTFENSGSAAKQMVVEHTKTAQTTLVSPPASEDTAALYRFNLPLPASRQTILTVTEQRPISETITLLPLRLDALISYSTNQEIPANVRRALERAVELRRAVDTAESQVRDIEAQRNRLIADQDRIRRNLEAAGNQTQQGQEYLRRLVALDGEIDTLSRSLERANGDVRTARTAFENYLNGLNL